MNEQTLTPDSTINQFVQDDMKRSAVFEELGMDSCCGGQKTLREACREKGLDSAEVFRRLTGTDSGVEAPALEEEDLSGASVSELIDHIVTTHHIYLKDSLPRLTGLMEKVLEAHGQRHPELRKLASLLKDLKADLEPHMMKEEGVLFPMIRKLDSRQGLDSFHCGSIGNPIRVMRMEHDRACACLVEIRKVTDEYSVPDDGCRSYRQLLEGLRELEENTLRHIHKENDLLFPRVLEEAADMMP